MKASAVFPDVSRMRATFLIVASSFLAFAASAGAAGVTKSDFAPARNLVTENVDVSRATRLAEPPTQWFTRAADVAAAPGDLTLRGLSVVLNRPSEREQALQERLVQLQDPRSPQYHRWLSPTDFGKQYGSSDEDIEAVTKWLSAAGVHVDRISNNRSQIFFSGTVSVIENAFATPLHVFSRDGDVRIGNTREPQIPDALLPAIHSIRGLHAWKQHRTASAVRKSLSTSASVKRPADTYCPNGGACSYTVFPADFAKIYDLDAANVSGLTGSGQTIAIVGRARIDPSDLTNFQKITAITFGAPTVIVPPDGVDPGSAATTCTTSNPDTCDSPPDAVLDQVEATLDVERAASIAPQATILLIVSSDVKASNGTLLDDGSDIATQYAIDTDPVPAKILSISFGVCEADVGRAGTAEEDSLFQQAAAEGISVFVSSGDAGAAGCGGDSGSTPTANQTLSINALCASGYVTCVGGTEFADTNDPSLYWAASDGVNFVSALGYIPEGVWNDPLDDNGKPQYAASGGGVSVYLPTPSWQTGVGVPGSQGRYVPDIAFAASSRESYFTCIAARGGSCVLDSNNEFNFIGGGGTSAATPSMAAITALLDQQTGAAQGNLNPRLYALAANAGNGVFHDVTIASSGVANCSVAVPSLCNNSTPGPDGLSGGLAGYLAGVGYDETTGLGSLDVGNFIANWNVQTSSGVNLDQHGLTGSWYNPSTSGQGFEIEVYPDAAGAGEGIFTAGWFTYDVVAGGGPRWYFLSGNVSSADTTAELEIAANYGGNFNAPSPMISKQLLGTATVHFSDCNHGTLVYSFTDGSGRAGTVPLARIDPNTGCGASGDSGADPANSLLSGNWYNSATSGQGLIFDISPSVTNLFAAWYTFAADGASIGGPASQRWYTLQFGQFSSSTTSATVPIYATSGGKFDDPAPVTAIQVGTADVSFQSCTSLTLAYHFTGGENDGLNGTINLTRAGPTPAGCKL